MPRLTNTDYLLQREFLRDAWNHFQGIYSNLTYNEQLELHTYFAPSKELSDQEAVAHRQQMTHDHPTFPHRAGKLYARLHKQALADRDRPTQVATTAHSKGNHRNITVRAVARAEPNLTSES